MEILAGYSSVFSKGDKSQFVANRITRPSGYSRDFSDTEETYVDLQLRYQIRHPSTTHKHYIILIIVLGKFAHFSFIV